jgi:hypothetical protein
LHASGVQVPNSDANSNGVSTDPLVPAIWLPDPPVTREREHTAFGFTWSRTRLVGMEVCKRLERPAIPQPWRKTLRAQLYLTDYLDSGIDAIEHGLRSSSDRHPYLPQLLAVPGSVGVPAFTIASQIGDITRFRSSRKLLGERACTPEHGGRLSGRTIRFVCPRSSRDAIASATSRSRRPPAGPPPVCVTPGVVVDCCCSSD